MLIGGWLGLAAAVHDERELQKGGGTPGGLCVWWRGFILANGSCTVREVRRKALDPIQISTPSCARFHANCPLLIPAQRAQTGHFDWGLSPQGHERAPCGACTRYGLSCVLMGQRLRGLD